MRIFIAHAPVDESLARSVAAALMSEGHSITHPLVSAADGADASSAEAANRALARSNFLVLLVSPESVLPGSQSLSQLLLFRKRWRKPRECILPITVRPLQDEAVPQSVEALGIVTPQGSLTADIANFIALRRAPAQRRQRLAIIAATGAVLIGLLAGVGYVVQRADEPPRELPTFTVGGKDQFVYWGGTPTYSLLIDKPGTINDYTCKLGKPTGPNIISATADPRCKSIVVKTIAGPFKGVGQGFEVGGTVPYVVTADDGTELQSGAVEVIMSNSSIGR